MGRQVKVKRFFSLSVVFAAVSCFDWSKSVCQNNSSLTALLQYCVRTVILLCGLRFYDLRFFCLPSTQRNHHFLCHNRAHWYDSLKQAKVKRFFGLSFIFLGICKWLVLSMRRF